MRETFYHEVKIFPWSSKETATYVFLIQPQYSVCVHGKYCKQNMNLFITDIQSKETLL